MKIFMLKVHGKGVVVLPSEVMKALGIREGSILELRVEGNRAEMIAPRSLLDLFGIDGEGALEVVKGMEEERRREIERELRD